MSASATTKKQCITCNKNGGILTCDGCQQIFCGKHVIEHRQQLARQLDTIMQEHDVLQHEIKRLVVNDFLVKKIDQWEKEYIAKIQVAAETSRKHLQTLTEQSKERLSQTCHDVAVEICSSREADDYSETDLVRWKEQLKTLKTESTFQTSVQITESQKKITHSITSSGVNSKKKESAISVQPSLPTTVLQTKVQCKFTDVLGPVALKNEGHLAKHTGPKSHYAYIRGDLLFKHGCHTIQVRLEQCEQPYRIFFGCISSKTASQKSTLDGSDVVGWFGLNQVYEHGRCSTNCKKYGYNSSKIKTNDVLHVTFDCDKKQMRLFNQRLNQTSTLNVNTDKTPYPWQLLMVMYYKDDCVKILPTL